LPYDDYNILSYCGEEVGYILTGMQSSENTNALLKKLDDVYGEVKPFLKHETPFQLLVAVILSAQTTDILVNSVTPLLFQHYPDAKSLKNASAASVEELVKKVNYFKTKAKNLIVTAKMIDEEFSGVIPDTIEDLIKLPGVGRKVANVVVADIYKKAVGFVVDTHVKRVSKRIGWTDFEDPVKIEQDLLKIIPESYWVNTPKQLILIGRTYCFANRVPNCSECPLREWCEKRI
jgi:endonuclease III